MNIHEAEQGIPFADTEARERKTVVRLPGSVKLEIVCGAVTITVCVNAVAAKFSITNARTDARREFDIQASTVKSAQDPADEVLRSLLTLSALGIDFLQSKPERDMVVLTMMSVWGIR